MTTDTAAHAATGDEDVSNVVLVTVDSLRADAIGPYDEQRHTPVLSSLGEDAAVFERAFATGNWTPFSFPSILASRPVFADGDIGVKNSPSLAATLSDASIETGGFNAANGFLTSFWGYDEGFDEFESFVAGVGNGLYSKYLATHPTVEAWLQLATAPFRRFAGKLRGGSDARPFLDTSRLFDVEERATAFVDGAEEPFFLWVHYMDAHTPYVPAPRYIREVSDDRVGTHRLLAHLRTGLGWEVDERTLQDLRTLYQGAVRQVDAGVGRLLDHLEDAGVRDETAVIVAGDHGEEFQDHGHLAHYPKLYDELIRVPLLIDLPGADGERVDGPVGLDDLPPTVTDLLGVEDPAAWTGSSLVPTVRDGEHPADDPVVSVAVRGESVTQQPIPRSLADGDLLVSVRDRDWTYVENLDAGGRELYHRPTDPTQQRNLLPADGGATAGAASGPAAAADGGHAGHPAVEDAPVDRFASLAADHAALLRQADADADGEMDEGLQRRLEALGYR